MPPDNSNTLASLASKAYQPIQNNKLKFICYAILALIGAFLLSATFGQHYDGSSQKLKGAPRRRDAPRTPSSPGSSDGSETIKDPFSNRPRIRTKNGHLVIEASQDKNIDFKTSGSRGTVTINGHKLDQLLNITKALEKSAQLIPNTSDSGGLLGGSAQMGDQYQLLLRNLFGSGERISLLEKGFTDLRGKFSDLDSRLASLTKKISKGLNLLAAMGKQQERMLAKLRRDNCFNAETGQPVCKNGATCVDAYDDFKCLCTAQWEGKLCGQDVDECIKFQGTELGCQNGAKCTNLPGGYRCECPAQFHGIHCTELHDDCGLSSSRSLCGFGKCVNLVRSTANQPRYECICDQGWTTDGLNPACVIDINECLAGHVPPSSGSPQLNGTLIKTNLGNHWELMGGTGSSSVQAGWPSSPMAAYPCSQNPYVECTNLPGSFQCGPCPAGYTGNGRICRDLDECLINNGGCSIQPLVECINTQGYRRCGLCPPGYTGDGVTCSRISACSGQPNGGCHPMAKCVELTGLSLSSRLCVCQYPYSGDGAGPDGCKPLPASVGPNPAGSGASASSQLNGTAPPPPLSDGQKQDDCNPNPCFNGATCLTTGFSFECICPLGWMGPTCLDPAPLCGGTFYASQGRIQFVLSAPLLNELSKFQTSDPLRVDNHSNNEITTSRPSSSSSSLSSSSAATGGNQRGERHYKCAWSITVASNMSIKLDLSELLNRINPSQRIQMFLANGTTTTGQLTRRMKPPNCEEFLDVWDRLDLGSVNYGSERRLLARFCSDSLRNNANSNLISIDPSKQVTIMTESHGAQLEWTFMATRTQFGEPSLAFHTSWQAINPPCGGEFILSPTQNPSGSISSPKFPEFYEPGTECRYLLRAPVGQRIRLQFAELSLLASGSQRTSLEQAPNSQECADSLTLLDGAIGTDRPVLFRHCANNVTLASGPRFPAGVIVSSSSTVEIILASNFNSTSPLLRPRQRKGFLLTYTEEAGAPGCGGLYTHRSGTIRSGDYEPAPSTSPEDEAYFSMQLATYMAERVSHLAEGAGNGSDLQQPSRLMHQVAHSFFWGRVRFSGWFKTRCEYTIRPDYSKAGRNHKISIDLLEMPRESDAAADGQSDGFVSRMLRRWSCSRSRLTVYDGDPLDGSNRTELMSFCSGDKYNSSSPMFAPILSAGRILYLVYETAITEDHSNGNANGGSGSNKNNGSSSSFSSISSSNQPNGFKLHYSTVCSAIYSHLQDRIQIEISQEIPECVYHIVLPPQNTISLLVEPKMSESTNLVNGVCAAQAIFLDGALQGGKSALIGLERQLRGYNLGSDGQNGNENNDNNGQAGSLSDNNLTTRVGGDTDDERISSLSSSSSLAAANSKLNSYAARDSYWQYSSSQVHDIKEFEVCKLPELGFDSVWNHLSILFRLNPLALAANQQPSETIQLTVRYRSESSCGGIISGPAGGKLRLEWSSQQSNNQPPLQPPTTLATTVAGQMARPQSNTKLRERTRDKAASLRPCAWVFKAATKQVIQLEFEAPVAEIKRRFDDWLSWSSSSSSSSAAHSSNSRTAGGIKLNSSPEFNCSQVFQESIEIYEPSLNRSRQLCPMDLLASSANSTINWVTASSIALIRLRNNTEPAGNSTATATATGRWPGLGPLNGPPILVSYQFLADKGRRCGGRLIHDSGIITSPRFPLFYPPQANCVWLIQAPNAHQQIRLNVSSFNLEGSFNCLFDYLELRNGPNEDSPLIGRFCGQDLQSKVLISHSNFVRLHFKSDGHLSRSGFEIRYDGAQTGCGGQLTTASGQIDSPNYPYPFAHSADCEWTIELSQSNKIELTIQDLDLSSENRDCSLNGTAGNYLAIYDSKLASMPLVKNCHKSQLVASNKTTLISGGNKFFIVYRSKALDNSRGFRLTYKTLCSNMELTGFRGAIESPGYPSSYPARIFCNWTIRAPLGSNLALAITELDTEDNAIGNDSGPTTRSSVDSVPIVDYNTRTINRARWRCTGDALVIWAVYSKSSKQLSSSSSSSNNLSIGNSTTMILGGNHTSFHPRPDGPENSRMINYYCGQLTKLNDADRYLELDTNVAYLSFESDRSIEGHGFRLEWRSEGCGSTQVSDSIEPIVYRELDTPPGRPTECLWSLQLAKAAGTMEFIITSDMRSANTLAPTAASNLKQDPCDSGSLTIYDGLTDKAPILNRNCDSQRNREMVSTSGGQVLIRFYTDGNNTYGRNFQLTGRLVHRDDCLSSVVDIQTPYNQRAGYKQSPLFPDLYDSIKYHCYGQVSTNNGRVRFILEELDIPVDTETVSTTSEVVQPSTSGGAGAGGLLSSEQCKRSGNYLLIKGLMGNNAAEEAFCGKLDSSNTLDVARTRIIMEQEAAWLEFHTSRAELRGRWRFSYDRLCGSSMQIYYERDFMTPNYPEKPKWPANGDLTTLSQQQQQQQQNQHEDRVCIWRLSTNYMASSKGSSDKKLHFGFINFIESSNPNDCLRVYEGVDLSLRASHFNLTDLDRRFGAKLKICKQADLTHQSLFYVSRGAELIVMVTGEAVAKFRVKPFEDYCGAELYLNEGEFASLAYPEPYAPNLDCNYFIIGAPGSNINLKFIDFDLPEGDNSMDDLNGTTKCDNVDYVEIRQLSIKKIIEHRLKRRNSESLGYPLLISYEQDDQEDSSPVRSSSSSNTTSQANRSPERLDYLSKLYNLFNDRRSSSNFMPSYFSLSQADFHENSNLLGRFCGKRVPTQLSIMRDQILVRLRSHGPITPGGLGGAGGGAQSNRAPRGFLAQYKLTYGGLFKLTDKSSMEGGVIGSPKYPGKISFNGSMIWTFETKLDYVLQFELVSIDLGSSHQECQDTLSIYDGLNPMTAVKLSRMCGYLIFQSKGSLTGGRGGGWPWSTAGNSANYTPIYRAHEPQVKVNLVRSVSSSSNVATVVYDNRRGDGSFLLRYRAINGTRFNYARNQTNNSMGGQFDDLEMEQPAAEMLELDTGGEKASKKCSSSYLLSLGQQQNSSQVQLTSPNWPKLPATGIECHWLIYTHDNNNIRLAFDPSSATGAASGSNDNDDNVDSDSISRRRSDYCLEAKSERRAFIVVHDGASRLAPLIGRYCLPVSPIQIKSSGRQMLVRYVNPSLERNADTNSKPPGLRSATRSLFKGLASVSECGGQYHVIVSTLIRHGKPDINKRLHVDSRSSSSSKQEVYANNQNCKYYLFAGSRDEVLTINEQLSSFDLAKEPTNGDCTIGDYLEIRDLPIKNDLMDYSRSQTGRLLGRFCHGHPLENLESPGSAISLEFKTDSENVAKGWSLFVSSSWPNLSCPRGYISFNMDSLYGRIASPNWPHGFTGKRQCRYLLVAPNNASIQLTFVRLRRPHPHDDGDIDGDQPERCSDSFNYLADNEAIALRYNQEPLADLQTPSLIRMRELVKTIPCNSTTLPLGASDHLDELLAAAPTGDEGAAGSQSFKSITGKEYYRLLELPQSSFAIQSTRSHVLLLSYEAKNLLPNEGFVAVVRILPAAPIYGCGGELDFRRLGSVKPGNNAADINNDNTNLIQSGAFGVETKLEEDHIQCEWKLKSHDNELLISSDSDPFMAQIADKIMQIFELANFTTSFIVFDTLEIPPLIAGQSLYSSQDEVAKSAAICGLNRLLISDGYYISSIYVCGNLTSSLKWITLDPYMTSITIRTKNLRLTSNSKDDSVPSNGNSLIKLETNFYRGVRGRLYEKNCPQKERLMGEGARFRSHYGYPNSSYQPGVCQWQVRLSGGDYQLWFDSVRFRLPPATNQAANGKSQNNCDSNLNDLDYLEIRASSGSDSPVLGRICAYNQMDYTQKKPLLLSMRSEIKLVFVAGIQRLTSGFETFEGDERDNERDNERDIQVLQAQSGVGAPSATATTNQESQPSGPNAGKYFGFDMELVRVRNISEFCRRDSRINIYSFIRNEKSFIYRWSPSMASFLYPKSTHCEIPMALDEGSRFNFTFRGMFDFESSPDCRSDYIQIDDVMGPDDSSSSSISPKINEEAVMASKRQSVARGADKSKSNKNNNNNGNKQDQSTRANNRTIGRWCGRVRPTGYFVSKSEKVRIIFHSNDRVEGKGFQLEYSIIPASNSTNTGNRQHFLDLFH